MVRRKFITYFDQHYLAKGLAMLRSLLRTNPDSEIYVVCCDERTQVAVMGEDKNHVIPISLRTIENKSENKKALTEAKSNRTWVEYLWTLTPFVLLYAIDTLKVYPKHSFAYVDADLYFFNSLDPLYGEVEGRNLAVIPHRWTPKYEERLKPNGIYNVSWVFVRNCYQSVEFLLDWKSLCLNWCYNTTSSQGVGDQGHLDKLVPKYDIYSVKHRGANLAPWNQEQYRYWKEGSCLYVDGYPLLFYHFHEFKHAANGALIQRTGYPIHEAVVRHIYPKYEAEIKEICDVLGTT
jgi:hypothetical protein